jgi:hypothetical protein
MFGAPDESRLYGSWQLAEGIRKGLVHPPMSGVSFPAGSLLRFRQGICFYAGYVKTKIRCEIATEQEKAAIGEREKGWKRPNDDSRA